MTMGEVHYIQRHGQKVAVENVYVSVVPSKKHHEQFVRIPKAWLPKLSAMNISTRWLAVALLWKSWRHYGRPFPCSSSLLEEFGLRRWHKDKGLIELERAGLITIRRARHRAPQITIV